MKTRRKSGIVPRTSNCTNCPGCRDGHGHDEASIVKDDRRKRRRISVSTGVSDTSVSSDINVNIADGESGNVTGIITDQGAVTTSDLGSSSRRVATTGELNHNTDQEIMKIDTKNYCLFCYKPCSLSPGDVDEENNETIKKEICSRYLKLLTRYLNLDIYSHITTSPSTLQRNFFTRSLKKGEDQFEIVACDACISILKSFCDLHYQLQHIQLQLDWNVLKLRSIMRCAERVPSRVNEFSGKVLEGENAMNEDEQALMNAFKREFFRKSIPKKYPRVAVNRVEGKGRANKRSKTVLLKRRVDILKDELQGKPCRNQGQPHPIEVLQIGQELRLSSCRPSASENFSSDGVENQTSRKSGLATSIPKTPSKSVQLEDTNASGKKASLDVTKRTAESNQGSNKKRLFLSHRPCPASRIPFERKRKQQERATVINLHPRVKPPKAKSVEAECEVIDLCESGGEETDDNDGKKEHIPAAQKSMAPSILIDQGTSTNPLQPPFSGNVPNRERKENTQQQQLSGDVRNQITQEHENVITLSPSPTPTQQGNVLPTTTAVFSADNIRRHDFDDQNPPGPTYHSPPPPQPNFEHFHYAGDGEMEGEIPHQMECPQVPNLNFPLPGFQFEGPVNTNDQSFSEPHPQQPMCGPFVDFNGGHGPQETLHSHYEFPVAPQLHGEGLHVPEVHTMSFTVTHTVTSTFNGLPPDADAPILDNFGIPSVFPTFDASPFCYNNSNDLGGSGSDFSSVPGEYFDPAPEPIVTEVDEDNNSGNSNGAHQYGTEIHEEIGVEISEVMDNVSDHDPTGEVEGTVIFQQQSNVNANDNSTQNSNDTTNVQHAF